MEELPTRPRQQTTTRLELEPGELEALVGPGDAHVRIIQQNTGVEMLDRDGALVVSGDEAAVALAARVLEALLAAVREGRRPSSADVKYAVRMLRQDPAADTALLVTQPVVITHRGKPIYPKTRGQNQYVAAMLEHEVVMCYGPAGTGKTYLAMAQAVAELRDGRVSRIVLTRPIVEAGEHLGFLPGDLGEKVDPYLRPLHDALQDILGPDRFRRHLERGTIEVVPLAYMRGRTINDAFMVLDEAQNTTPGQMKMFLTRMGFSSRVVVTGDITQSDLPEGQPSGFVHALEILSRVEGVAFVELTGNDIVRHDLVQRIVRAYESRGEAGRDGADEHGEKE
ncbi:MAG: PhoH family protein [Armatimonadetes bacterium]|nr:PhoH family protein [Armatimonadota bacterium]